MKQIIVNTIDGTTAEKTDCRKMGGNYYLKGDVKIENSGQCYFINEKYYKYNTGYIIYDHRIKSYILKNDAKKQQFIEKGIIGFDKKNVPILGSFTMDNQFTEPIKLNYKSIIFSCLNEEIIKNNKNFLENLEDGIFYDRQKIDSYLFMTPLKCDKGYKFNLPYDSRGITEDSTRLYNELYEPKFCSILKKLDNLTNNFTFGLEFETIKGKIPSRITDKLGLIPLRDGSISGLEYVTIPLKGNKGLQTILDSLKELKKRTIYDNNCAFHIHIGNIPRTEKFFVAMFKLLFILQDDIFDLFPFHKKYNYGVKRKHYTKPLPLNDPMLLFDNVIDNSNIKKNFSILYKFLSMGQEYSKLGSLDKVKCHPSDPGGHGKWNIRTRYYWVNLIPLLFGNKETIEFRIHTPTYDENKIINFMLICFAIVKFTIDNEKTILGNFKSMPGISLSNVLFEVYKNDKTLIEELQKYCDNRTQHFYNKTRNGDFLANEEDFMYNYRYLDWCSGEKKVRKLRGSLHSTINTHFYQANMPIQQFEAPNHGIVQQIEGNIKVPEEIVENIIINEEEILQEIHNKLNNLNDDNG